MDFFRDFGSGNPAPGNHWLPGMCCIVAFGTLAYHVVGFRIMRKVFESLYSTCSWWPYLKTYKGLICRDVQKEVVYISIVCLHHLVGGGLMAYGSMANAPHCFVAGAVVGLFDDFHDSLCMLLPAWPFGGDGEKRDVKLVTLLLIHHTAAIVCTFPALLSGLYLSPHVQAVGAWLLLAGGCSHATLALSRTCNRTIPSEAKFDALVWIIGGAFYTYSRLYAFPKEMMTIFRKDYAQLAPALQNAIIGFTILMGSFNLLIFIDVASNTVKRVKIAFGGCEKSKN